MFFDPKKTFYFDPNNILFDAYPHYSNALTKSRTPRSWIYPWANAIIQDSASE